MTDVLGTGLAVTDVTAGGLVAIIVIAVLLGRLIPKATHDRELGDMRAQRDQLMAAREIDQKIIAEQSQQISLLTEGARLATRVADAIHQAQDSAGRG